MMLSTEYGYHSFSLCIEMYTQESLNYPMKVIMLNNIN